MAAQNLFANVASVDFLGFGFGGRSYSDQLADATGKTGTVCAVRCDIRIVDGRPVMWVSHDFGFMGGSLGCAEGEKLVLAFEKAREDRLPIVVECKSGGARMQEGTLALMQLAKVSVAVSAFRELKIPYIVVNLDPTYGGVSASYAMQGDVRIGVKEARIGFAGPSVILNTVYEMDQGRYDAECPQGFQSAEFLLKHGQLDMVVETEAHVEPMVAAILKVMLPVAGAASSGSPAGKAPSAPASAPAADYVASRRLDRCQSQDIIGQVFTDFVELKGDGKVGADTCIRGGIGRLDGRSCVVIATYKGHNPLDMKTANFGMGSPHGYRFALRLMQLADHFGYPVITLVDTPGAFPSFDSETLGQSEALATNLIAMSGLRVPIVSLIVGEGGSGGALGIAMGNKVAMMSRAYYAVISPEGAASILGRYDTPEAKTRQFPVDCRALAASQKIFASDLQALGVIDTVIAEEDSETFGSCPITMGRIRDFLVSSLQELCNLKPEILISERYSKFRGMGKFGSLSAEELSRASTSSTPKKTPSKGTKGGESAKTSKTLQYLADRTINGDNSAFLSKAPTDIILPVVPKSPALANPNETNAKRVLDTQGPEAVAAWVLAEHAKGRCLVTDTTMRDAHQSLLATRVRTVDLLKAAEETSVRLKDAFSIEMWGGATFDVAYRFLHESPWDRLRALRNKMPNILFQMLIRGANAVGYKSYPDNLVVRFIELSAEHGMDVFRIFDCFNDLSQMQLCIDTVRRVNKIAEVAICFTGNFLSPKETIYTLEYYADLARRFTAAGAHIICIKDMAGLLRPNMAAKLMETMRASTNLPIHYHTHATSSAALATCIAMAKAGCQILDFCTASMADTTSQPSMNAFLASMEGESVDPKIDYLTLEPLDVLWSQIRTLYSPFESGLKSGSARVYDHQIPGGQYSNLYAQCKDMGLMERWDEVLDKYRDVNALFGDIVKVTPSSKCVGDMALYLVTRNMSTQDCLTRGGDVEFPDSVISLFLGELGNPHRGFPSEIERIVLKGKAKMTDRPGALLAPVDFEAERTKLQTKYVVSFTDEDVVSYLLYPKVFEEYLTFLNKFGDKCQYLETQIFYYGMQLGDETNTVTPSLTYNIKLKRVGPLQQGAMRTVTFEVNGEKREVVVKDRTHEAPGSDLPRADANDPKQIGAPMPGAIDKMFVSKGSEVARGDKIMTVAAMKMEVLVTAPYDGVVDALHVEVGMRVDQGTLVATLSKSKTMMVREDSLATGLHLLAK